MNILKKFQEDARNNLAVATAAAVGLVSLAGCEAYYGKPEELKPETRAQLKKALRPAATEIGSRVLSFAKRNPEVAHITDDPDIAGGYTIFVYEGSLEDHDDIRVSMRGTRGKMGKLTLRPSTTYEAELYSTLPLAGGAENYNNSLIRNTERPDHDRKAWFAFEYFNIEKNSETELEALADSHINDQSDPEEVKTAVNFAERVADSLTDRIETALQEIEK